MTKQYWWASLNWITKIHIDWVSLNGGGSVSLHIKVMPIGMVTWPSTVDWGNVGQDGGTTFCCYYDHPQSVVVISYFLLRPPILMWPPYADTTYYFLLGNAGQGWWCGVDYKSSIWHYLWVHLWWFSVLKFVFCTNSWCKSLIFRYIYWGPMQGH